MMIQGPGGNLSVFQAAQVQPGRLTESVVFGESSLPQRLSLWCNTLGGEPRRPLSTSEHKVGVRAVANFIHPNKLTVTVTVTVCLSPLMKFCRHLRYALMGALLAWMMYPLKRSSAAVRSC
jgi:hypothetical protein